MDDEGADRFETVAITWSQPEAAVMLAMFAFYGIPAFAVGRWHAATHPAMTVGLQGIAIRVIDGAREKALDLLAEVAERPAAVRPYVFGNALLYRALIGFSVFLLLLSLVARAPWFAALGGMPLLLLFACPPPTRTAAVFMLWKRRNSASGSPPL